MINLVRKDNLNIGILETDFTVYSDIVNTFISENAKKEYLIDIDENIIPEYFKNKITVVIQTNKMLVGYAIFEFKNTNNAYHAEISKLYVLDTFKEKGMENLLIESVVYISSEVGVRNTMASVGEYDKETLQFYKNLGFYEVGINENGSLLSVNTSAFVTSRKLVDKFRDIPKDFVDYKSLKLVKKISVGSQSNIYLTGDNQILKMFTSNSFIYIKNREDVIKDLIKINIDEVIKPKKMVYYDGIFVGYIMEYLPEGKTLWEEHENYSFEEKIDKIRTIEDVIKKLHKNGIYMCDIDSNNIFFDKNGNVKFIDCDSFVTKKEVLNNTINSKYRDPKNKIVSEQTDIYAFAIIILELLINVTIPKDATKEEVEKIYNKNKNKLPASFKQYYNNLFKFEDRIYLSESYEQYLNELYNVDDDNVLKDNKSGNVSVIILSIIMVVIAVIGYFVLKNL